MLATVTFFCPKCEGERRGSRRVQRRWFTLFFVSVFPVGKELNEHVKCETCSTTYLPAILDRAKPAA